MSSFLVTSKLVKLIAKEGISIKYLQFSCSFNQNWNHACVNHVKHKQVWIMKQFQRKICSHRMPLYISATIDDGNVESLSKDYNIEKGDDTKVKNRDSIGKLSSNQSSRERNFLTAIRAMSEFMLRPADLENLRKTKRRSPFENEPPITVYWRRDVESRAIEVWGNLKAMEEAKRLRDLQIKNHQEYYYNLKGILRSYQKANQKANQETPVVTQKKPKKSLDKAGTVVWGAVIINGVNFLMKLTGWAYTGSHSMFAEALHSLADVTNQLILAYGIHKSGQEANMTHPYGYTTMRYVASLVSGAMIFCVGSGLSIQHGISGLMHPSEVVPVTWVFYMLGCSLLSESCTLIMAFKIILQGAKRNNVTPFQYVLRGADPTVNVVFLEDMAAVMGVCVAFTCMGLSAYTGSHIPDAVGSCIIGSLLAGVAGFIVYTNTAALVGRSIPHADLQKINNELEADVMIRAIHDVKGIDMGSGFVRYKAEVDFDGREITKNYIDKLDIQALLTEMNAIKTDEEAISFLLKHGENVVDSLGAEVDRIEQKLIKKHPEIRHCDLEIL